ncbi:MAG TPA: glycosyltransferase [Steroidobacteraceae bacterium]|nr:glycosyltransferase [Steroidobacteraceae bacterium]
MPSVLIISYWHAPSPAVGAKRFSFLAREFVRHGYDVHVITHESRDWIHWKTDGSLPQAGQVHRCAERVKLPLPRRRWASRIANALLTRLLAPIGWEWPWARAAARKALEVARDLEPGVVIATSPAHAAVLAGHAVARRLGWPLIIDYRDPWSAHHWPRWRRGPVSQWFARRIESRLVRHSAARVLNTPAMLASFDEFFPHADRARNFVIPNGFDAAPGPLQSLPASGPIHIVHAGEIFTGRSLVPVLEAAARLAPRYPQRPVRVITYGELPPAELARIRAARLESFLEVRERIPFRALFAELRRAHLLLAVVGEHMLYSTPYKVYDYMAAGRPILGVAPRGAALFELLAESGAGVCVARDDGAAIEHALEQFMIGAVTTRGARVERFRWENLALQYRAVIETVTREGSPAAIGRQASAARGALDS